MAFTFMLRRLRDSNPRHFLSALAFQASGISHSPKPPMRSTAEGTLLEKDSIRTADLANQCNTLVALPSMYHMMHINYRLFIH